MSAVTDRIRGCCDQCAQSKIKCDSRRPNCLNCRRRDRPCTYSYVRQSGRPRRARPNPNNKTTDPSIVEELDGESMPITARQYGALSTTAAAPSSPPALADITSRLGRFSHGRCKKWLSNEESRHNDREYRFAEFDLTPENTIVDFLDSFAVPDTQHTLSAEYLAMETVEPNFSMNIDNTIHNPERDGTLLDNEKTPTAVGQGASLSHQLTGVSQLEQGLHDIFDDGKTSCIVDVMMNASRQKNRTSHVAELRDGNLRVTEDHAPDDHRLCRCPTMLNKLYLIVRDPNLSQLSEVVPFDLILFLEQALRDAVEKVKHCRTCRTTLSSENGITVCIIADWIINRVQTALETEIAVHRNPSSSLWGYPERSTLDTGVLREHSHDTFNSSVTMLPSLDIRNTLKLGMWCASREAWILCMSAILDGRIKRIQQMLFAVDEDSLEDMDIMRSRMMVRVKSEMARDIQSNAEILLGMVKIWVSECHL